MRMIPHWRGEVKGGGEKQPWGEQHRVWDCIRPIYTTANTGPTLSRQRMEQDDALSDSDLTLGHRSNLRDVFGAIHGPAGRNARFR